MYPEIEPFETGRLQVDEVHNLYWEQCGNPAGAPVVFLHGGPGAGTTPKDRRFFDPDHYRAILFHQRGAGESTPLADVRNNTTEHLVADIERLRQQFGIDRWHVFGGSWGSTLALAYAQSHPDVCWSLVLRGIFLMRKKEIDWWLYTMGAIFPERRREFVDFLPAHERGDLLEAYYRRLFSEAPDERLAAAKTWSRYEGACCTLRPNPEFLEALSNDHTALAVARLEAHYMRNGRFEPDDLLLRRVDAIRHIPAIIVQGRYDMVCPPETADELHLAWPEADYTVIEDAGHSSWEPGIAAALVAATDTFRSLPQ